MNRLDTGAAVEALINEFYDPLIDAGFIRQHDQAGDQTGEQAMAA
jgi:tRNA-dihydrouridine synthase B